MTFQILAILRILRLSSQRHAEVEKRKTKRGEFTSEELQLAINEVIQRNRPIQAVAKEHGINRVTLTRYVREEAKD